MVWDRFDIKTMKGYQDLFLKCDVFIVSLKHYGICPSHYINAPG